MRVEGKSEAVELWTFSPRPDLLARQKTAWESYSTGGWSSARCEFAALLADGPQDGLAQSFLERLNDQLTPPPGWDGVWTMEGK